MGGQAVHARGGQRSAYRPLESRLCKRAYQPLRLLTALLTWHPFRCVYLADLDAIRGTGNNKAIVRRIKRHFPRLRLWLDEGIRDRITLSKCYVEGLATPVIGSETLTDLDVLASPKVAPGNPEPILSLDYLDEHFLGPPGLESEPSLWPKEVILMTLSRVGSGLGSDIAGLRHLRNLSPRTKLYAAGGVRNASDLNRLHALDLTGVLIASALHDDKLSRETLAGYD